MAVVAWRRGNTGIIYDIIWGVVGDFWTGGLS